MHLSSWPKISSKVESNHFEKQIDTEGTTYLKEKSDLLLDIPSTSNISVYKVHKEVSTDIRNKTMPSILSD